MRLRYYLYFLLATLCLIGITMCNNLDDETPDIIEFDDNDDDELASNTLIDESDNDSNDVVNSDENEIIEEDTYDLYHPPGLVSSCIFPDDPTVGMISNHNIFVLITSMLMRYTLGAIYAGKPRSVIVGIENTLSSGNNYWVHYIYASLYHQKNKLQLIQNLTAIKYVQPVMAQSGSSFNYIIWLHESFAEKNFTLVIFAHMTNDKHEYIYPVYNETIRFLELPEDTYDMKFLFLIAVLTTTSAIISKLIINKFTKNIKNNKRKHITTTHVTKTNEIDYDWLPAELLKNTKTDKSKRSS